MRHIIRHLDSTTEEIEADSLAINQHGLLVLVKQGEVILTMVPQNIVSISAPDGPPQVAIAKVTL